ncbi:MAG: glutathione S-transferase family protein [Candidatus Thiodiazotropha sp. (ex Codakia rugifera)]|nr:glutathione S-transferase family protein [Candidatus Thiodiazotropha sp. (ex Codakia rugifera)]
MSTGNNLYDKPECPFCWRVRMALNRCGVVYNRYAYDNPEHEQAWHALTPNKTVPVISFDKLVMVDSSVILEYLNDVYGILLPPSANDRADARGIASYADVRVGGPVRELVFERRERPPKAWDQEAIARAMKTWHQALPFLEKALSDKDYFVPCAGIPDYVLASRFGLAMAYGMPAPQSPLLADWFDRMIKRSEFTDTAPAIVIEAVTKGWQL